MSTIIAIANQKGGVGKTTTAMNLAVELHRRGRRVLCIDLDHQGNLSDYLSHEPDGGPTITHLMTAAVQQPEKISALLPSAIRVAKEGVSYIPADINLSTAELFLATAMFRERALKTVLSNPALPEYDFILIDCLPSLGILLTNALIAANGVLIPVQAQKFALDGMDGLLSLIGQVKAQANSNLTVYGLLVTMRDNTKIANYVASELRRQFGDRVFQTEISKLTEAANSAAMRESLVGKKNSRVGEQYRAVVDELLDGRC